MWLFLFSCFIDKLYFLYSLLFFLFKVQANGKLSEVHIDSGTGIEAVPGGPRKLEQELAECEPALQW